MNNIISSFQNIIPVHTSNNNEDNHNEGISGEKKNINTTIETTFKLPIEYLDAKYIKVLSETVCQDLELAAINNQSQSNDTGNLECYDNDKCMYEHLFTPENQFALEMIQQWKHKFTTNIPFLKDSQQIIKDTHKYNTIMKTFTQNTDPEQILEIWQNTKENLYFHEQYNYLDWDMLKHLNESSSFLQILSFIHLMSPVISFILPLFMLIFPFIILKIQGIPITVSVYLDTLKSIGKNHIIGKVLFNMGSISWDKLAYLCFSIGLYIFQIYQNINVCRKFYKNIITMNNDIVHLTDYLDYSISSMKAFSQLHCDKQSHSAFCAITQSHIQNLEKLHNEVVCITPFATSFQKFGQIGEMLKLYYVLYTNQTYEDSLRYSVGFEGYINNISNLYAHTKSNTISMCTFSEKENKCVFNDQYYPAIVDTKPITNNLDVSTNIIISAPNKAGKTTILKSTLINIIMSQQVGCGFYSNAQITPYSHIHSYLNIPDTSGRDSLFQAESRRCKEIIDIIKNNDKTDRHFCIFDELYSGTNPEEAVKSGNAFLKYIDSFKNVNFILTTHYKDICKKYKKSKHITNYKMMVEVNDDKTFNYTYKLVKGISSIKGGLRVLKDMEYPEEIIQDIENN
tara:strand:+ start:9080 stop:10954 length:1875 start_codon:yes stop_codon:yes gene_type:complete